MEEFRTATAHSLKGKVGEHGFFLRSIVEVTKVISQKHAVQDYPLNDEIDQLNYFFSAYLNTIQSLKDGCSTVSGVTLSWAALSPTYGGFIRFCRNATTHDGSHVINAALLPKSYVSGTLRRLDGRGEVVECEPPREDVRTLCLNISEEILSGIEQRITEGAWQLPAIGKPDVGRMVEVIQKCDSIPEEFKRLIQEDMPNLVASIEAFDFSTVKPIPQQLLNAVAQVRDYVSTTRST